jgi:transposase InsO family protein
MPATPADEAEIVARMRAICDQSKVRLPSRVGVAFRHQGIIVNSKRVRGLIRVNEEVVASLAEARAVIQRWRLDYNEVRPHSAHRGLTPEAAHLRSAGDRLRNPDQLRRAPATIEAPAPV